jgi:hypothetical protein
VATFSRWSFVKNCARSEANKHAPERYTHTPDIHTRVAFLFVCVRVDEGCAVGVMLCVGVGGLGVSLGVSLGEMKI